MRLRFLAFAALAAVLVPAVGAQGTQGASLLPQFVRAMNWAPAKGGPLVAIYANDGRTATTLEGFGRKTVAVGGLTAVAPKERIAVDSRFREAPNLYDGLPQSTKMLYLLSTLDPGQWARAAGEGIGRGDLRGEQAAVFESILPDPFRYTIATVEGPNSLLMSEKPEDQKALTGADRRGIRLRIVRHLELDFSLRDGNGYTSTNFEESWRPGARLAHVVEDRDAEFGHRALVKQPNVLRPGDLDLRNGGLGAAIPLKADETVPMLLARVSAATGLRIVADPHYANLNVVEVGASAAARDLLGAAALGTTGTFRRVGDGYVLTNDLEGMAAHQVRLAVWEETVRSEVFARERGWRAAVAASGGLARAGFSGAAYEGLTEAERANLAANDRSNDPAYVPIASASPAIARAMKEYSGGNDIDRNRIGLYSSVRFEIVLPDGTTTSMPVQLGQASQFGERPERVPAAAPSVTLPLAVGPGLTGLLLRADSPEAAATLVERAARLGVRSLLLETRRRDALVAAVAAGRAKGVKVSLALRPWEALSGSTRDFDRTVAGLHGKTLAAAKADLPPWAEVWSREPGPEPPTRELLGPLDPAVPAQTATFAGLAATPGLASVVVLDLYAPGYAKANSRSYSIYSPALDGFMAYGYTDAGRAAFFRASGIDPLDIENPIVNLGIELGPAWGDQPGDYGAFERWQKARGEWAHDAALRLVRALGASAPGLPILLTGQPPINHIPPEAVVALRAWTPGTELPLAPNPFVDANPVGTDLQLLAVGDDKDPALRGRTASFLHDRLAHPGTPLVLDLSSVPADRLGAVLTRWLKARTP